MTDPRTKHLSKHQWKKGQSGNPSGRPVREKPKPPPKPLTLSEMRDAIRNHVPAVIAKLVEQALAGDTRASAILLDKAIPSLKAISLDVTSGELPVLVMNLSGDKHISSVVEGTLTASENEGREG